MKVFAISLARHHQRRSFIEKELVKTNIEYEIIDAVDGSTLTEADLAAQCDMNRVNEVRWLLNNGAIGCALSHYNAYQQIVAQSLPYALIIEDDTVLPHNLGEMLSTLEPLLSPKELVLLYYTSFKPLELSTVEAIPTPFGRLMKPLKAISAKTASAYIISQEVAQRLLEKVKPIRATADDWLFFYRQGCFDGIRCLYPRQFSVANFKSTIDYVPQNTFMAKMLRWIDRWQVPGLYHYLKYRRQRNLQKMLSETVLVDTEAPLKYSR